ncbi:putative nrps-t1pks biosynthetic cluster [Epichloe bromicola]|uniref:Nrps-t1pks biosynthetic cluster n=1 Tax=Epichloe bromicola TaxID=79588 RepID=A0ABQ0CXE0_9HYPO
MKIGAVYVPLDVAMPVPRLSLMCNDCKPAAILVNEYTVNRVQGLSFSSETPIIDVANIPKPQNDVMIPSLAQAGAASIILYTSGSTGIPKAVVLQHTSLVQEIEHCARTYKLENHDVVLQQSAWSFDLSVSQMFVALCVGARLQIVSHTMRSDPDSIIRTISRHGITATYATPTEYKSWLARDRKMIASMSAWRLALVAGDPVTRDLLQLFRGLNRKDVRLFNIYGPTETTCGSTKMELRYQDPELGQCGIIPVGWASVNEAVYILDSNQNLQPIGQTGEVVIGGVGVSLGYFNDAESTRAAFVSNPFVTSEDISRGWTTMYRTGDLGYLQPDGSLILKSRVAGDTEIKLNGFRINLAEIEETVLLSADGANSDAVACLRSSSKHGDTQFVVVYVVFNCNSALGSDRSSFLQRLLQNLPLPSTTRPSALAPVQEIPRSLSGKVDRQALSRMPLSPMDSDFSRPSGMLHRELLLRTIWEQVIPDELVQLGQIDAETDFFSDGGSSLLLIQLQNKLEELLQISVPLLQLFQASTLRSMARLLANVEELEEHTRDAEHIDWNQETMIMADLFPKEVSPALPANLPSVPPRVVVLTGATGFLGRHLVEALLDGEHVNKVICIAVRNLSFDDTYPMELKSKLEFYQGDLTLPQLGLDDAAVSQIFGVADAVIHNGADVSHLKTYASLRKANFVSTQELVKMCLSRNVPLHYISTTGVSMYTSSETMAPVSVRHSHPPMDGHYGYIASKWASEVFLENVQDKYGLPVVIHRPSSIIRPESDRVIESVMGPPRQSHAGGITYIHESGDVELRIRSMREHVQKATRGPVVEIPLDEWLLLAKAQGLSDSMASVFEGIGSGEGLNFPQLVTGGHGEPLFPNQS